MIGRTIKRGVLACIVTGALGYGIFGSDVGSYFKTLITTGRRAAKEGISIEFELDRARGLTDRILADTASMLKTLSRLEVSSQNLERDIERSRAAADGLRRRVLQLRNQAEHATQTATASGDIEAAREKIDNRLATAFKLYKLRKQVVTQQEKALAKKQAAATALRDRLVKLRSERLTLAAQIETLEATIQCIKASEDYSDSEINDTLAKTREILDQVGRKTRVLARVAENRREFLAPTENETSELDELSSNASGGEILLAVDEYLQDEDRQDQTP